MAKPVVSEARIGQDADLTRIELHLSAAVKFHTFYLMNPYRLVIDMDEIAWRAPGGQNLRGSGLVASMRYGLFKPGTSRVVLDLAGPAQVTSAHLAGAPATDTGRPAVLVVDLKPSTEADFRLVAQGKAPPVTPAPAAAAQSAAAQTVTQPLPASSFAASAVSADGKAKRHADPADGLAPIGDQPAAGDPAGKGSNAAGDTAKSAKSVSLKPMIVIDPGHGGIDPGALGSDGIQEKNITLAVGRALKKELLSTGRYRVMMTRDKDVYIPLRDRFKVARDNSGDLFISLHADSYDNPLLRGATVYTLSENASDTEAAALAARENKSDIIAGVDLSKQNGMVTDILIDLAQRDTINLSSRFASDLVSELKTDTLMLEHSHRSAGFAVLKAPDVPSVLLEMGYISSSKDQQLLVSKAHQAKLAKAIRRAIDDFFDWHELVKR
ncbi:MAG: N-acetylmuramoyl-L-alanine amidase [Dongiaceae bacterium]